MSKSLYLTVIVSLDENGTILSLPSYHMRENYNWIYMHCPAWISWETRFFGIPHHGCHFHGLYLAVKQYVPYIFHST